MIRDMPPWFGRGQQLVWDKIWVRTKLDSTAYWPLEQLRVPIKDANARCSTLWPRQW